jgi:hypothetical protein
MDVQIKPNDRIIIDCAYKIINLPEVIDSLNNRFKVGTSEKELADSIVKTNRKYFISPTMQSKGEYFSKAKYLWIDTGYHRKHKPIYVSLMIKDDKTAEGYYLGTAQYFSENSRSKLPTLAQKRELEENMNIFDEKERVVEWSSNLFSEAFKQVENLKVAPDNTLENTSEKQKEEKKVVNRLTSNTVQYSKKKADLKDGQEDEEYREIYPWCKTLYEELLFKNWRSVSGLIRFFRLIGTRISDLVKQGKTEYYIQNKAGSVIINTGLFDSFGNDIRLMYRKHLGKNSYVVYKRIDDKAGALEENFSKEDLRRKLKSISFFDGDNKVVKEVTIDDFDISSRSLEHIIEERADRFPDSVKSLSKDQLADKINASLNKGVKMLERDSFYAKPIYSTKLRTITWCLPLHIFTSLSEAPELVLIFREDNGFYTIKTVLPYDDEMQDRITAVSLYGTKW